MPVVILTLFCRPTLLADNDQPDPGHFGPSTFRHHQTGAEVSRQFGTSAEVSQGHFGTGAQLSRPPANIFCYNRPHERKV